MDLLGVIEDGPMRREVAAGGTSMYHYSSNLLSRQAEEGNLFVLHLVTEGKILHDTLNYFKSVKANFTYKNSYQEEITDSTLIVLFFLERPQLVAQKAARKRLIWAIRTILIAQNAENRTPVFSSAALAAFSGFSELKDAIDHRNQPNVSLLLKTARRVLNRFGSQDILVRGWPEGRPAQRALMGDRGGIVKDTLRFVRPAALVKSRVPNVSFDNSTDVSLYLD